LPVGTSSGLARIELVDLRGKTEVDLIKTHVDSARALIANAGQNMPLAPDWVLRLLLQWADSRSRQWLKRTRNPYLAEIDCLAQIVGVPGVHALNCSYEWACTSGAFATGNSVTMLRILDWPLPGLGEHVLVTRRLGAAGEFYNVGWPGMSGMLTGMAPRRFCATLNQAPMRNHHLTKLGDWLKNRAIVDQTEGLPPLHLLRKIFEEACSYREACVMAATLPVALPVIFCLSGTRPGQGCVIERTEHDAVTMELGFKPHVTAANQFVSRLNAQGFGWRPRTEHSAQRLALSKTVEVSDLARDDFGWLKAPMVNELTRLIVLADAGTGRLVVQGMAGDRCVSELFRLGI
jgi:hypothetical protein